MYFVATRHLHDLAWWIILFTGLWAVFRAWRGRLARLPWTRKERLAGLVFSSALATQLLIGLALYFQSPLVHALFAGGAAGLDPQAAIFFGLLHPLIMFTAVVLGQVGFSVSKRLSGDRRKYVIATGCYTAALAVVLLAVLWAWFSYGRPLLPYHAHTRGWDLQPPQPTAVPVAVNKRLAGIYPVGSWIPDRSGLGGFGPCDNYPFDLGEAAWGTGGAISLVAFPDEPVAYFKFRGIAVRLINCSGELASFPACDSCLQMVQEAQGADGRWRPIESWPDSDCGNSYHRVFLGPDQYWQFPARLYSGPAKTKLRFRLDCGQGPPLYSNEFEGAVNAAQFEDPADNRQGLAPPPDPVFNSALKPTSCYVELYDPWTKSSAGGHAEQNGDDDLPDPDRPPTTPAR
jgi:hypothetical protein